MRIRNHWRAFPVLVAAALLGCGKNDIPGPGISTGCGLLGTSNLNVAGAVSGAIDGCAFYGVSADPTSPIFGVTLTAGTAATPTHTLTFGRQSVRPPVGTYDVGTVPPAMEGSLVFKGAVNRTFELTSGSITITTSSPGTLNGSVNMTAVETSDPSHSVTITGSFAARCFVTSTNNC